MPLKADCGLGKSEDCFREIVLTRKSSGACDTAVRMPSASLATAHISGVFTARITKCVWASIPRADHGFIKHVVSVLSTKLGARMALAVLYNAAHVAWSLSSCLLFLLFLCRNGKWLFAVLVELKTHWGVRTGAALINALFQPKAQTVPLCTLRLCWRANELYLIIYLLTSSEKTPH